MMAFLVTRPCACSVPVSAVISAAIRPLLPVQALFSLHSTRSGRFVCSLWLRRFLPLPYRKPPHGISGRQTPSRWVKVLAVEAAPCLKLIRLHLQANLTQDAGGALAVALIAGIGDGATARVRFQHD